MAAINASRLTAAPVSKLVSKLLLSARPAAVPARRSFNASADRDYTSDERSLDIDRRPDDSPDTRRRRSDDLPSFFSDAFDPFFGPTRSLSQVLNLVDQMMDSPLRGAAAPRRGWDAKEDKDALHLRIDMPGLGKEHVQVLAEQGTLIIKGEGEKESEEEGYGRRYSSRIDLPTELYRMDQIKAEMKNGVLKVVVPKVKEEDRKDVFQVSVE